MIVSFGFTTEELTKLGQKLAEIETSIVTINAKLTVEQKKSTEGLPAVIQQCRNNINDLKKIFNV